MEDNLPPIVPPALRTRVAVPVPPPVLRPSLIPHDVLQDARREAQSRPEEVLDPEIRTAPVPVGDTAPVLGQVQADLEVALFALTQVRLFKDLPVASLEALAAGAVQIEVPDGELLFNEGDDAVSFFVVVDGTLEIQRQKDGREVRLRHVTRGEAFGLFGLFSAQLRAASVRAIGDCTVLEISGERLQALLNTDDQLHDRLIRFYRERLVEGFMASKLFTDIDSIARARLIGRFVNQELDAGQALLQPGEVGNLLAVVTHGAVVLEERAKAGAPPRHFEVTQGQFLAVTCAMSGLPSKMRVFAPSFATLSVLPHKDLNELLRDYPALRAMPARLPSVANQLDRDVFCGTTGVPGL
ncbi:MAG: cyclic nucleotide-binding domain-containing protein [Myxococcota bacterium]